LRKPWSFETERQMLRLLIGRRFGEAPEERVEEIREERRRHAAQVVARLRIDESDVVADLGSGCGFMAGPVAAAARHLHCLDVSEDFAAVCARETAGLPNVTVHVIEPGRLRQAGRRRVTKAFSHAVFMHLNLFDAVLYLREFRRVLPEGGLLLIDINDLDRIDTGRRRGLQRPPRPLPRDRSVVFDLMQWHSAESFARVARQNGFELLDQKPRGAGPTRSCCSAGSEGRGGRRQRAPPPRPAEVVAAAGGGGEQRLGVLVARAREDLGQRRPAPRSGRGASPRPGRRPGPRRAGRG
jgi:SAM-dependent methyltransferase